MSDTAADALVQFDGLMPTEVDVLQELVRASGATDALEIGMARATSSLAILAALPSNGTLTSIDPFQLREQDGYGGAGVEAVRQSGFSDRHRQNVDYDYVRHTVIAG